MNYSDVAMTTVAMGDEGVFREKEHDWKLYTILSTVSSAASVLGALCILFSILFPHRRSMSRHFIYMMSFSDIMVALPILCGCVYRIATDGHPLPSGVWCKVQAFFVTVGSLLSFLWTLGLSQHMFLLVKYGVNVAYVAYRCFWFLTLVPIAINIYAYHADILGTIKVCNHTVNPMSWCWINVNVDKGEHCMALLWDGKVWEMFSYCVVFVYCVMTYWHLNKVNRNAEPDTPDPTQSLFVRAHKIILIAPVYVLARMPGTIITMVFVYNGCSKAMTFDNSNRFMLVLIYLRTILDASQGWINWILFWLTIEGNKECLKLCGRTCCWRNSGPREEPRSVTGRGGETLWRYSIDSVDD